MEISLLLMQQIAELFLMIFMGYVIVKAGLLRGGRQQGYIKDRFVSDHSLCYHQCVPGGLYQ